MHLQLRGLPANAFVTLDGEPASSTLTLSRSEHPYDLTVTAPGKVAWHISYVPRADEALDVSLRDAPASPPPPPAAAPPKRTAPRKKHKPKSLAAARARLLSAARKLSSAIFDRALDVADDAVFLSVNVQVWRLTLSVRLSVSGTVRQTADHAPTAHPKAAE